MSTEERDEAGVSDVEPGGAAAEGEELEQEVEAAEAAGTDPVAGGAATPEPVAAEGTPSTATPDDANDLRGYHFRRLLHKPLTWILVGGGSLALGVILLIAFNAAVGAIAFVVAFLFALWLTFNVADSRAADDFFHVYAQQRNLALGGKTSLPPAVPLLRRGDDQYAERTLTGELAPGVGGLLAIYTYVTESTDSNGNREKTYHPFTIGMTDVQECVAHVPELYCQRKSGLRALEKFEDVFRTSKERVTLESEALADRYEIFSAKGQDAIWLRRLFSPTFIVWLTESAPDKFGFELVDGTLVGYVRGHKEDTTDLDKVAAATSLVATKLREESAETPDTPGAAG